MAKQKGIFKVRGTLGDASFYKSRDGYLVREKSSLDGKRILHDPAFARTRENNAEFARAAQSGKLIRQAFRLLLMSARDARMVSRLTRELMICLRMDENHSRGERIPDDYIGRLEGFDFNINGKLSTTVYVPYSVTADQATGNAAINMEAYSATATIVAPEGTTHYQLRAAAATIDFQASAFEVQAAEDAVLPFDATPQEAKTLTMQLTASSTACLLVAFGITFSQEVNGEYYPLKNGAFNALSLVSVLPAV